MPTIADWLRASWRDFIRRWTVLMAAAGLTAAATLLAVFLPLLAAGLAALAGADSFTAFGLGGCAALVLALWFSTWAQAAVLRACLFEESVVEVLSRSWDMTAGFAWALTLFLVAAGGGFFLLLLPGLFLSVLLFFGPVYQMSGEAEGVRAMELSWARVRPRFAAVGLRLFVGLSVTWLPGAIPYVGWILAPFWAPFGIVATARLARDLREASPDAAPARLAPLFAVLGLVFTLGAALSGRSALRAYAAGREAILSGRLNAEGLDEETGQAMIAVLSGRASEAQRRQALAFALSKSRQTFQAPLSSSTLSAPGP
ncbi:MAG: hypothetical protein A2X37_10240 [Elusimicrobia bacterium GWA2_66_18]|nr:MAG: hypothetical protein A2X37_10240 [Elusimicrobia bacterium GWA2_66_18]